VATFEEPLGPVVDEHGTEAPPGAVTVQVSVPVGVIPLPLTVAVKISVCPADTTGELSVTDIVGVTVVTVVA
jgi:hypothetical protein